MAFDMSRVRIVPDAPTSVPATISSWLFSVNPAIATASPVYAFSSEITTGMSAPPIGITRATPKTRARSVMTAIKSIGSIANDPAIAPPSTTSESNAVAAAMPPVTSCWPA